MAKEKTGWYLRSLGAERGRQWEIPLGGPLFRVGRAAGQELILHAVSVSKRHAEIYATDDGLRVRDVGSRNGTYVNEEQVADGSLAEGDLIGFGDVTFRLERGPAAVTRDTTAPSLSVGRLVDQARLLPRLLRTGGTVDLVFQPIVPFDGGPVLGHEALGRGRHPDLPEAPDELFRLAAAVGCEAELSRLFRSLLPGKLSGGPPAAPVFLNIHPEEMQPAVLCEALAALIDAVPGLRLVLEIHERAVADVATVAELRRSLASLGIGLAYDDFGAGQDRLLQLADAPPDFLKFDQAFVRGLDAASPSRHRLLRTLIDAARELGARSIAEGVETAGEAAACREIGFEAAQGFYFAPPGPLASNSVSLT